MCLEPSLRTSHTVSFAVLSDSFQRVFYGLPYGVRVFFIRVFRIFFMGCLQSTLTGVQGVQDLLYGVQSLP